LCKRLQRPSICRQGGRHLRVHPAGQFTELRKGGYEKSVGPGGFITESRDVEHWAENRSRAKVVLMGVDLLKP